jgi:hypothetical protein
MRKNKAIYTKIIGYDNYCKKINQIQDFAHEIDHIYENLWKNFYTWKMEVSNSSTAFKHF